MRFLAADGNVISNGDSQLPEEIDQKSCGGLAIHVKIAPDANTFFMVYGAQQSIGAFRDSGQFTRIGRMIAGRIQEGNHAGRVIHPFFYQHFSQVGRNIELFLHAVRNDDRFGSEPALAQYGISSA